MFHGKVTLSFARAWRHVIEFRGCFFGSSKTILEELTAWPLKVAEFEHQSKVIGRINVRLVCASPYPLSQRVIPAAIVMLRLYSETLHTRSLN